MTSRGGIDYSKWDKWVGNDASSDEEPDERGLPQVTRFDQPMSVTIGGKGDDDDTNTTKPSPVAGPAEGHISPPSSTSTKKTTSGPTAVSKVEDLSENGSTSEAYAWRQDRNEVILTIWVPPETKAKDVIVRIDDGHLTVALPSQTLLFGELANSVKIDEDTGVDWQLIGNSSSPTSTSLRRAISITLPKSVPRPDMIHWWSRVLKGEDEIDTSKIQGRKGDFAKAWEEAQAMFRDKIRQQKEGGGGGLQQIVDLGEESAQEEA